MPSPLLRNFHSRFRSRVLARFSAASAGPGSWPVPQEGQSGTVQVSSPSGQKLESGNGASLDNCFLRKRVSGENALPRGDSVWALVLPPAIATPGEAYGAPLPGSRLRPTQRFQRLKRHAFSHRWPHMNNPFACRMSPCTAPCAPSSCRCTRAHTHKRTPWANSA